MDRWAAPVMRNGDQVFKMNPIREYTIQSVFAALDSALIIGGSLMTATLMKARGYPDPAQFWHPWALFVHSWGFLLILIPGVWVVGSIWLERQPGSGFTRRWVFVSGLVLLVALALLMGVSVMLGSGAGTLVSTTK